MRRDERSERAAQYRRKAQEAYRLAAEAKPPEIHNACLILAARRNTLARFQFCDQVSELVDQARGEEGWSAPERPPVRYGICKSQAR